MQIISIGTPTKMALGVGIFDKIKITCGNLGI